MWLLFYGLLASGTVFVVFLVVRQWVLWYWRVDEVVKELTLMRALLLQLVKQGAAQAGDVVAVTVPAVVAEPGLAPTPAPALVPALATTDWTPRAPSVSPTKV